MRATSARRQKILIVDDEPDIVRAVAYRLRGAGYEVIHAGDGTSGIIKAARERPDLLLLDIGLPDGDGHVVAASVRANIDTVHTPILFFSARNSLADVHKARACGAVGFVSKPYQPDELLRRVRMALGTIDLDDRD
jgi:DNA-binding response OmpR family regulator